MQSAAQVETQCTCLFEGAALVGNLYQSMKRLVYQIETACTINDVPITDLDGAGSRDRVSLISRKGNQLVQTQVTQRGALTICLLIVELPMCLKEYCLLTPMKLALE